MFVIVRDDGKFVAVPGLQHSFTDKLQNAWLFASRTVAEANACSGNETVKHIEEVLMTPCNV